KPNQETIEEGMIVIERNARAQARIIADLLDMSRIISGKVRLDMQQVDPTAIVQSSLDSVWPSAEAKSIQLRSRLNPDAGPLLADPNRLQQVVWNLLTNAVKFTPVGGSIDVELERVNSHTELRVIDSGRGVAPNFLPHVFDRFRQADATATRAHGGLGL